jgi:hypothetical protein
MDRQLVHTMYAFAGKRAGGLICWYSKGISPLFIDFREITEGHSILALDVYSDGAIESRDIITKFYRLQRLVRGWLRFRRALRAACRPSNILRRELTGRPLAHQLSYNSGLSRRPR